MFKKTKKSPRDKFNRITKKRETIFSLYFGWRLRVILERTTRILKIHLVGLRIFDNKRREGEIIMKKK
jgi:hypothetical protein